MAEGGDRPKIILHWLDMSRSQRILWLLEELELEYEVKVYKRGKDKLAPPELTKVHPLGKSPVLEILPPGADKPLVLAESGALTEYLCDYYGKRLVPKRYPEGKDGQLGLEREEWLRYRYFMHYNEGSLMTLMIVAIVVGGIRSAPVPFFLKPVTKGIAGKVDDMYLSPNFKTHLAFIEEKLSTSPNDGEFLCGKELTAADILMSFPLEVAFSPMGSNQDKTAYPKINAYLQKLQDQEGYKRASKKAQDLTGEENKTI